MVKGYVSDCLRHAIVCIDRCGPGHSEAWGYTEEGPLLFSKSVRKRQYRTDNAGPGVLAYIARRECYTVRCKASYFSREDSPCSARRAQRASAYQYKGAGQAQFGLAGMQTVELT